MCNERDQSRANMRPLPPGELLSLEESKSSCPFGSKERGGIDVHTVQFAEGRTRTQLQMVPGSNDQTQVQYGDPFIRICLFPDQGGSVLRLCLGGTIKLDHSNLSSIIADNTCYRPCGNERRFHRQVLRGLWGVVCLKGTLEEDAMLEMVPESVIIVNRPGFLRTASFEEPFVRQNAFLITPLQS